MATAVMDSRDAIFTVELPSGRVYTGAATGVSISENRPVSEVRRLDDDISAFSAGPCTWEIELRGIGPLTVAAGAMFRDVLEDGPPERQGWECPYCGNTWPHLKLKCWDGVNGCGATRPAMWWI